MLMPTLPRPGHHRGLLPGVGELLRADLHQATNGRLSWDWFSVLTQTGLGCACSCGGECVWAGACVWVLDVWLGVIRRENRGFSLFILQINLTSNPVHSNVLGKGKEALIPPMTSI